MQDLLRKPTPTIYELVLVIPLALIITAFIAVIDISIFDGYVLPQLAECYPENTSDFCIDVRERLGLQPNEQIKIGDLYWDILESIVIIFGTTLFVIRIVFGKLAGARWSLMLFFVASLWFISITILFYSGFIDTFYYILRGIEVPMTLEWLDQSGIFQITKQFGETTSVDKSDLYLTNGIGITVLIGFWFWMHYHHSKRHFRWLN